MPPNESLKRTLRRELRAKRRSLSATDHDRKSKLAASAITRLPAFKAGARIAVYLPFDGEPDPAGLLQAARKRRVRVFVPVVESIRHRRLRFLPLTGRTRRGAFGISVPHARILKAAVGPRWFNLIVIPLVGVDGHGRRLGMGGGFYDRALGFRRIRQSWPGPKLVGLAFQCQRTDSVFAEPHDVRLDAVATERGVQHFAKEPHA
jgi:5-formyltetrahydrofolate cyclo-ligase